MKIGLRNKGLAPCAALLLGLACSAVAAGDSGGAIGSEIKTSGVVVEKSGDSFLLRNLQGVETEVRVGSGVEIEEKKKNFFREGLRYSPADIVPGLRVEVEGYWGSSGAVEAEKIKFTQDDLKVARVVDSRLVPLESRLDTMAQESGQLRGQMEELEVVTRQNRSDARQAHMRAEEAMLNADAAHRRLDTAESEIGALERRFGDLADYDVMDQATVLFPAGATTLSAEAKKALDDLAESLESRRGYLLEVMGYASADGDESMNRRLSEKRAAAVVRYLTENLSIEPRHFVTPLGFGENRPVADNSTRDGRVQNRRVEVRLLVNRAFTGGNAPTERAASGGSRPAYQTGGVRQ